MWREGVYLIRQFKLGQFSLQSYEQRLLVVGRRRVRDVTHLLHSYLELMKRFVDHILRLRVAYLLLLGYSIKSFLN